MKVNVYNSKAEVVGEVELNPKIFEVKPNTHLLAEAVRIQLSNKRQGTAHTKTRGEVRGGGKKPWKQKGTGRARAGSTRSPLWRHGGVTFGPRSNRNWTLKLNKQAARQAMLMALSDKAKEQHLVVVDQMKMDKPKTRQVAETFKALVKQTALGKSQLLVVGGSDKNLVRSSRNIATLTPIMANSLNLHAILKADSLVILKDALTIIEKTYLK